MVLLGGGIAIYLALAGAARMHPPLVPYTPTPRA